MNCSAARARGGMFIAIKTSSLRESMRFCVFEGLSCITANHQYDVIFRQLNNGGVLHLL
jgi:hypothetical protein